MSRVVSRTPCPVPCPVSRVPYSASSNPRPVPCIPCTVSRILPHVPYVAGKQRLEAGINREVRESEEAHAVMFEGLQATLAAAATAVEVQAEASITARFEPGLDQHVRETVQG